MHEIRASDSRSIPDDLELRLRLRNDMKKEEIEEQA